MPGLAVPTTPASAYRWTWPLKLKPFIIFRSRWWMVGPAASAAVVKCLATNDHGMCCILTGSVCENCQKETFETSWSCAPNEVMISEAAAQAFEDEGVRPAKNVRFLDGQPVKHAFTVLHLVCTEAHFSLHIVTRTDAWCWPCDPISCPAHNRKRYPTLFFSGFPAQMLFDGFPAKV